MAAAQPLILFSHSGVNCLSILNVLKRFMDDELAKEGITPELLEMVDLSVEYTPVIPFAGGGVDDAITVRPWGFVTDDVLPEKFEVCHPLVHNPVSRESLKVMRARYLLARDAYYGPMIHRFFQGLANATNADLAATESHRRAEDGD
ncbi:hypothetical protein [Thalassoglobus sp.]|uniref:hypothetical protein n=1 Tax=Thalassoglobus sp. TaxID=2795869 RepID=UPI003AA9BCB5